MRGVIATLAAGLLSGLAAKSALKVVDWRLNGDFEDLLGWRWVRSMCRSVAEAVFEETRLLIDPFSISFWSSSDKLAIARRTSLAFTE